MAKIRGGDKLDAALKKIGEGLAKKPSLHVGFLANAKYPDGTSVALVAAVNEFGSATSPPRPAFRNMIAEKSDGWPEQLGKILVENDYDAEKALALVGEGIKGQLQESIATFTGVPLKPATIKRKGNDKQLVDTGHELASVDYEVKTK